MWWKREETGRKGEKESKTSKGVIMLHIRGIMKLAF